MSKYALSSYKIFFPLKIPAGCAKGVDVWDVRASIHTTMDKFMPRLTPGMVTATFILHFTFSSTLFSR